LAKLRSSFRGPALPPFVLLLVLLLIHVHGDISCRGGLQHLIKEVRATDYAKAGERLVSKAGVRTRGLQLISGEWENPSSSCSTVCSPFSSLMVPAFFSMTPAFARMFENEVRCGC
jgi:hypothetical protein